MAGGRLTTHVLDTMAGIPAAGVEIALSRTEEDGTETLLTSARTDAAGRTESPLLDGETIAAGRYELVFRVGEYFAARGVSLPDPPFVDDISIRFGIADPAAHYHVPLLVSPWSYATYRGS